MAVNAEGWTNHKGRHEPGRDACEPRSVPVDARAVRAEVEADLDLSAAGRAGAQGRPMRPPSPQASRARSRAQATARSGLARPLSRHASEGRAQDRAPDAAQARGPV